MTKDDVLALLEQAGAPVSGEQMCKTLGLTRAAVWKAIEALRADGYEIEAATRRGYFLCTCPLTKSALERRLAGQFPAERLIVLPEVDSTNNYLKTLAANGASDGTAVLSLKQTAGRGRRGRSFLSEPGGLYLSFLMRPQEPAEALLHLTALAGLCVCTAVKQVTGMQAGIKWPNDPVLNGKKLCGILTELSVSLETQEPEYVVIGIGVNVPHGRKRRADSARGRHEAGQSRRHWERRGAACRVPGRDDGKHLVRRGVGARTVWVCIKEHAT